MTSDPAGSGARADLVEDKEGWTLTVTLDRQTMEAIAVLSTDAEVNTVPLEGLTMSVAPNLVPGDPFQVATVSLRIVDDVRRRSQ